MSPCFIEDDVSSIWTKMTDVQKAELRKIFADIKLDLVKTSHLITNCEIQYEVSKKQNQTEVSQS